MYFPVHVHTGNFVDNDPRKAAKQIWESDMYDILTNMHTAAGTFYYRIDYKGDSEFSRKLASELDQISEGTLIHLLNMKSRLNLYQIKRADFFAA